MARPVLLVSGPRSGSTYAVALLGSHPRIHMTNEAAWVTFLRKTFLLSSTPSSQAIDDGEGFATPGILPEKYTEAVAHSYLSVMRPFVDELYRRVGPDLASCDYYGDKVMGVRDLEFAAKWFEESVFVHLVRDPRDTIASTFAFSEKQPALWDTSTFETRVQHMAHFLERTAAILAQRQSVRVRYEDLMTDNAAQVRAIFEFLELDVTPEVEAFVDAGAKKLFSSHATAKSPSASIGRWREDLSSEQQEIATRGLASVLEQFGYAR
ncbi:MAG: sulfotransferase [bacterium]|nr:sulfotransferase [bacterium]